MRGFIEIIYQRAHAETYTTPSERGDDVEVTIDTDSESTPFTAPDGTSPHDIILSTVGAVVGDSDPIEERAYRYSRPIFEGDGVSADGRTAHFIVHEETDE